MDLKANQINKLAFVFCALAIGLLAFRADAAITDVTGPVSSVGTAAEIIPAPPEVLNSNVFNTGQQGFNEATVVTTEDYAIDSGLIPAGTLVSSHMIFLNAENGTTFPPLLTHEDVEWTFSQAILGVMSDNEGSYEVASSSELGAPGTIYPAAPFTARGLEPGGPGGLHTDGYSVSGNEITVTMHVSQPGDWIRVVTCAQGSQGFWKNYEGAWPLDPIEIGGVEYTQDAAVAIMETPVQGDKTLTMFPQLVAAKLNVATSGCSSCSEVSEAIAAADAWMVTYTPGSSVKASSDAWQDAEPLYDTLNAYNNEELTCSPGTPD